MLDIFPLGKKSLKRMTGLELPASGICIEEHGFRQRGISTLGILKDKV